MSRSTLHINHATLDNSDLRIFLLLSLSLFITCVARESLVKKKRLQLRRDAAFNDKQGFFVKKVFLTPSQKDLRPLLFCPSYSQHPWSCVVAFVAKNDLLQMPKQPFHDKIFFRNIHGTIMSYTLVFNTNQVKTFSRQRDRFLTYFGGSYGPRICNTSME